MQTRRRVVVLGLLALFAAWILVLSPGALFSVKPRLNVDRFNEVRSGMHLEEVKRLMGGPPGEYGRYWFEPGGQTEEGFFCPPDSRGFKPPNGLMWTDDNHSFEFCFDDQGVLIAKHQRAAYGRSPRTVMRILSVLGLYGVFAWLERPN